MSSVHIKSKCFVWILLATVSAGHSAAQQGSSTASTAPPVAAEKVDPAAIFRRGQDALLRGQLEDAERDFQQVLQLDPQAGPAYANLGVVSMRRKQWTRALPSLEKAARLMPQTSGIRLNIGLAYYRQNEFLKAIPPFESVVRDQPDALQPRYLLGLCYFFANRWADSAGTLEPLWPQESSHLAYLYVLSNAAHRAGRTELDERAAGQLIKIGSDTPEYHLFRGKYHLNLDQYDLAISEFEAAAKADPKFPFVHFNLGLAHFKKQEYDAARVEFMKDAAVEPDLALNYDQLGDLYWLAQNDAQAEKNYREALRRDSHLVNSLLGLAKIYQRQHKYAAALAEADAAVKADPARPDVHYVRGQALLRLGRKEEASSELKAASRAQKTSGAVPSPELLQESQ